MPQTIADHIFSLLPFMLQWLAKISLTKAEWGLLQVYRLQPLLNYTQLCSCCSHVMLKVPWRNFLFCSFLCSSPFLVFLTISLSGIFVVCLLKYLMAQTQIIHTFSNIIPMSVHLKDEYVTSKQDPRRYMETSIK